MCKSDLVCFRWSLHIQLKMQKVCSSQLSETLIQVQFYMCHIQLSCKLLTFGGTVLPNIVGRLFKQSLDEGYQNHGRNRFQSEISKCVSLLYHNM